MVHWNTVNETLKSTLHELMRAKELEPFRLVGGTALSLHLGHRMSVDIDLFTDVPYRSVDFVSIETYLRSQFPHVQEDFGGNSVMGKSYIVGNGPNDMVKLDIFYANDPFFQEIQTVDNIRLATVEEIIAMKIDVVQRGGRKKDFWDLHETLDNYSIDDMIDLHRKRSEYVHDESLIINNLTDFTMADQDLDPICLRGKEWAFIKDDIAEAVASR